MIRTTLVEAFFSCTILQQVTSVCGVFSCVWQKMGKDVQSKIHVKQPGLITTAAESNYHSVEKIINIKL